MADAAASTSRIKFSILEQQLAKTAFLGGEACNMSDFMVASVLYILSRLTLDLRPYPRLDAWLKTALNVRRHAVHADCEKLERALRMPGTATADFGGIRVRVNSNGCDFLVLAGPLI